MPHSDQPVLSRRVSYALVGVCVLLSRPAVCQPQTEQTLKLTAADAYELAGLFSERQQPIMPGADAARFLNCCLARAYMQLPAGANRWQQFLESRPDLPGRYLSSTSGSTWEALDRLARAEPVPPLPSGLPEPPVALSPDTIRLRGPEPAVTRAAALLRLFDLPAAPLRLRVRVFEVPRALVPPVAKAPEEGSLAERTRVSYERVRLASGWPEAARLLEPGEQSCVADTVVLTRSRATAVVSLGRVLLSPQPAQAQQAEVVNSHQTALHVSASTAVGTGGDVSLQVSCRCSESAAAWGGATPGRETDTSASSIGSVLTVPAGDTLVAVAAAGLLHHFQKPLFEYRPADNALLVAITPQAEATATPDILPAPVREPVREVLNALLAAAVQARRDALLLGLPDEEATVVKTRAGEGEWQQLTVLPPGWSRRVEEEFRDWLSSQAGFTAPGLPGKLHDRVIGTRYLDEGGKRLGVMLVWQRV